MRRLLTLLGGGIGLLWLACSPPGDRVVAELELGSTDLALGVAEHRSVEVLLRAQRWPILGGCPTIFVHLVDPAGKTVRSFDHQPPFWKPGEEVRYSLSLYQSMLSQPLPSGEYRLVMGAYDPESGRKFRLRFLGARDDKRRYTVGSVRIGETERPQAQARFGPAWYPPESGTDVQVMQRRWFLDRATLEITGPISRDSSLWMLVYLPESEHLLEISRPPDTPREGWVGGDCFEEPQQFTAGRTELRVPLPALAAGERCQVELVSSFSFFDRGLRRSASLEALAWSGG